jgi:N-acetylglucosamine-6-phosphate deacetylase
VLPAHLESNFVNPDYAGAQPIACLRMPRHSHGSRGDGFSGAEILDVIASSRGDVGIVTLAPELPGGVELVRHLASAGHRVSLGHSAADFETASEAIDAGARHVTHLFNRMAPLGHRAPGLAGAVLSREEVAAEIICDGFHVHPAMARMAIAAKGPRGIMAITDGTAGSGLPPGSGVHLGGRLITVREKAAFLEDGTLAGSTVTMDRVFGTIVRQFGRSVVDAACMCATTPANALALADAGALAHGMRADLVVMTRNFEVEWTFLNGEAIYHRSSVRATGRRT